MTLYVYLKKGLYPSELPIQIVITGLQPRKANDTSGTVPASHEPFKKISTYRKKHLAFKEYNPFEFPYVTCLQ